MKLEGAVFYNAEFSAPWSFSVTGVVENRTTRPADRFRHYLAEPPMSYLTRWRLQLGARLLSTTSRGVGQIAVEVGYDSEAAFNRAFKREYGAPAARFRTSSKFGCDRTAAVGR